MLTLTVSHPRHPWLSVSCQPICFLVRPLKMTHIPSPPPPPSAFQPASMFRVCACPTSRLRSPPLPAHRALSTPSSRAPRTWRTTWAGPRTRPVSGRTTTSSPP